MDTSPTVRDRIIAAADTLYKESGSRSIPTVDAVRKLARVNINDASNCMREWRRANATAAEPPRLQVPDKLQQSGSSALQALWTEAVNLCGETLRMAQAGWDAERADAEALSEQIASACAAQEEELLVVKALVEKQAQEIQRLNELLEASQRQATAAEHSLNELRSASIQIEARSEEIGRRADDLRRALDQAHAIHTATSSEQAVLLNAQVEEIANLRGQLEAARQKSESSAVAVRLELISALEEAARLRGKLEAFADAKEFVPTRSKRPPSEGKLNQSEPHDGEL
jgi:DNA repair exonuclease SbcCD ATPase subunit